MEFIERMRWWQWIAVSLVLGALLGYLNSGPANPPVDHSSTSPMIFETSVTENSFVNPTDHSRHPMVSGILIHPVEKIQVGGKTVQYQLVTFTAFIEPSREHPSGSTQPQAMLAPYPYEPQPRFAPSFLRWQYPGVTRYIGRANDTLESLAKNFYHAVTPQGKRAIINANPSLRDARNASQLKIRRGRAYWIPWNPAEGHTVADFIDAANKMAAGHPNEAAISYRRAWWESPNYVYEIWMLGSFLLIGIIWPAILRTISQSGARQAAQKQYQFKGASSPAEPEPAAKAGVTNDDMQRLHDLEQTMMTSLASEPAPSAPAAAPVAQPVKKLNAEPAAAPPPAPAIPEENKSYEGEFYPVARSSAEKKE